ncbi:MAG TPA: hypothetical protein VFM02_00595 [Candidatus Paceibacterota bacterium]|nr:hypothetical protein [Candidatus Paceibacterota bacterium]
MSSHRAQNDGRPGYPKKHGDKNQIPSAFQKPDEELEVPEKGVSWRAPEYIYREKSTDWYWILGIITIAFAILAIVLNNLLFGIFILIAGFTAAMYGSRKPDILHFHADERGIQMESKLYPYQTLDFFWIDETGEEVILIIESKKRTSPYIIFPVAGIDPDKLRNYLNQFIPEEYIERPWTEQILDRIGF